MVTSPLKAVAGSIPAPIYTSDDEFHIYICVCEHLVKIYSHQLPSLLKCP